MNKMRIIIFVLGLGVFLNPLLSFCAVDPEFSIANLVKQQSDSIVLVGTVDKKKGKIGSGFIVRSDGLILTNYHLVKNARKMYVKLLNGTGYQRITVVKTDPAKDLALIQVDGASLPAVKLGDSRHIEIGQRVVAIGNPLGLENTVSDGLISALRPMTKTFDLFQISVPLSSGSSGGPLFNLEGEVIGITTASLKGGQNLNFAIPINYAKELLAKSQISHLHRKTSSDKKNLSGNRRSLADPRDQDRLVHRYVIQPHDTLYTLAKRFDVTVEELMALNHLPDSRVYIGQKIKIPRKGD